MGFFFFFFFCSFFRKFLLERWAARSKKCVLLFGVRRVERRSPRSILAHAQASCWHTHTHTHHAVMLGFSAAAHPTKYTCSYSGQLLTLAPCSHARVLGCRSSHEVYLLILGPAVDACPMQYVSARAHAVILEFSAGTHTVPCRRISNAQTIPTYRRKPMNIADRLWRHADRLWACRRLREAEACLLSCLRVSDTNIHHVSYETKEAV